MYTLVVILVAILCLMIGFVMGISFCEKKLSEAKDLAIKTKKLNEAISERDAFKLSMQERDEIEKRWRANQQGLSGSKYFN